MKRAPVVEPEDAPLWLALCREGELRPALDTSGRGTVHLHDGRGALCERWAVPFGKAFLADYELCEECVRRYLARAKSVGRQVMMKL